MKTGHSSAHSRASCTYALKGNTLKNGFFEKLKKRLGHSRRPIYTNFQPSKSVGVATLCADISTNTHRKKQKTGCSSEASDGNTLIWIQ